MVFDIWIDSHLKDDNLDKTQLKTFLKSNSYHLKHSNIDDEWFIKDKKGYYLGSIIRWQRHQQ